MHSNRKLGVGLLTFAAILGVIVIAIFVKIFWRDPGSSRNSAIVRRVEAAGSGNVDWHPRLIAPFFDTHVDLAKELMPQCKAVVVPADVNWSATTEGMVCAQAETVVAHGPGYRDPELQRRIAERSVQ